MRVIGVTVHGLYIGIIQGLRVAVKDVKLKYHTGFPLTAMEGLGLSYQIGYNQMEKNMAYEMNARIEYDYRVLWRLR